MSNRETRLEFMTAPEIAEYMSELNLLYIPVAPLEWHGPHLPYGTDPLNAYAVCLEASRRFGGLVHPIVYAGTEVARRPELVEAFGLPSGTTVIGMDMPGFALKSFYMPPEQFRNCVRAVISTAASVGFSKHSQAIFASENRDWMLRMISHYGYSKPGATYTAGVWVKTEGLFKDADGGAYLSLDFQSNDGTTLHSIVSEEKVAGTRDWVYLEVTGVAPPSQRISVVLHVKGTEGVAYFDDAYLAMVKAPAEEK